MLSRIGLSSRLALSSASGPHGYQSTGLSACWRRYGLVSLARRLDMTIDRGSVIHSRVAMEFALNHRSGIYAVNDSCSARRRAGVFVFSGPRDRDPMIYLIFCCPDSTFCAPLMSIDQ